ncbi:MAG: 50S ribosomal protein L24e [Thermoplasmata archaeon]
MVEARQCSFCGTKIEPGTGKIYIKKEGSVYHFCTGKCKKNMIDLKRKDRETRWTRKFAQEKAIKTYPKKSKKKGKPRKKIIRKNKG